ncbi:CoA-transferase [Rickettsia oklahomensis]|uniref:CoA-transferase n=1 Tax=Rickettsia oklahomensis TaxID=3141789 RepID=A0AAU7BYQ3_9RICK
MHGNYSFFTKTSIGTIVEEGKETKEFNGKKYIMDNTTSS